MFTEPTFLMTEASAFDVPYAINPWMKPEAWSADPAARRRDALAGSTALRHALEDSGATVRLVPAAGGLPDLVFPANAAVVLDGKALVARFRHPERRGEEPLFLAAFEQMKAEGLLTDVAQFDEGMFQEGAGDAIWDANRRHFWVGSGPRSRPETAEIIASHFGQKIVHLPLESDRFYHLDTCFCVLSGGEILYYPPALTAEARERFEAIVPPEQRIVATDEDASAFCVNAVCLGRTIVMAQPPASLRQRLEALGYTVIGVDLSAFILSGGAAYCMTLRLDLRSQPVAAATPARAEMAA